MGRLMRQYWIPVLQSSDLPEPDARRCACGCCAKIWSAFRNFRGKSVCWIMLSAPLRVAFFSDATRRTACAAFITAGNLTWKAGAWTFPTSRQAANSTNKSESPRIRVREKNGIVWTYLGRGMTIRRRCRNWAGRMVEQAPRGAALPARVQLAAGDGRRF